jgi:UDP-N-acetylglucosamine--N-acetylmuramyl-(pentapeptide) pyrophosphoryl-undecaprenol N-acetylglucosamine transferase
VRVAASGSRILIAGGGTGGHLMPALSVAQTLRDLPGGFEPVLVGARRGVEASLLPQRNFRYHLLPAEPIYRRQWWKNARWPFVGISLLSRLHRLFREEHPVAVLGTGGYASAPVVWWATRLGIPTAIQEQNAYPGLANRWLARRVSEIYLGLPEARSFLQAGPHTAVVDTGNPIAPPAPGRRAEAIQRFGLRTGRKVLLVTGGSQGALAINQAVAEWLGDSSPPDFDILWVTGPGTYESFKHFHEPPRVQVIPFLDPMAHGYAVADLVVSRAGMITVAELCAWGLPSILIPLPTAAADHQTGNAKAMELAGAAQLLPQPELTGRRLAEEVGRLFEFTEARQEMAEHARSRGRPDAARDIAARLAALAR